MKDEMKYKENTMKMVTYFWIGRERFYNAFRPKEECITVRCDACIYMTFTI